MVFDLSAAFDTVDKSIRLPKLSKMGINGRELNWFQSYLTDGHQCVEWNGTRWEFVVVSYGVRQGSIWGPVLYL
jgi:hypothetical protein